jgi:hypothetical protein
LSPFFAIIISFGFIALLAVLAGLVLKYGMGKRLGNRDDDIMLQQFYAGVVAEQKRPGQTDGAGNGQGSAAANKAAALSTQAAQARGEISPAAPRLQPQPLHPPRLALKAEFMGHAETLMYLALSAAFPKMVVFCHVHAAQLLQIDEREIGPLLGEPGNLAVDFVICKNHGDKVAVGLAIELKRPGPEREAVHEKKRAILRKSGIPLLVYGTESLPDANALRHDVSRLMAEKRKHHESGHHHRDGVRPPS